MHVLCLLGLLAYALCGFSFCFVFCCLVDLPENVKQISFNELRSASDDFHSSNRIGRGGFGTVYKVKKFIDIVKNVQSSGVMSIMCWEWGMQKYTGDGIGGRVHAQSLCIIDIR